MTLSLDIISSRVALLGFTLIEYAGRTHGHSTVKCMTCGDICKTRVDNLAKYKPCSCSKTSRYTKESIDRVVAEIVQKQLLVREARVATYDGINSNILVEFSCSTMEERRLADLISANSAGSNIKPNNRLSFEQICSRVKSGHIVCLESGKYKMFRCLVHGINYKRRLVDHEKGSGCEKCKSEHLSSIRSMPREEVQSKLENLKRGFIYDLSNYRNTESKILIECQQGHTFKQSVVKHLSGQGCPSCARYGFSVDRPSYFYVIRVNMDDTPILKYGITNRNPADRLLSIQRKSGYSCEILLEVQSVGHNCLSIERFVREHTEVVASKESVPDGYTETCKDSEESWNTIIIGVNKYAENFILKDKKW